MVGSTARGRSKSVSWRSRVPAWRIASSFCAAQSTRAPTTAAASGKDVRWHREEQLLAVVKPNAEPVAAVEDLCDDAKLATCRALPPAHKAPDDDLHREHLPNTIKAEPSLSVSKPLKAESTASTCFRNDTPHGGAPNV